MTSTTRPESTDIPHAGDQLLTMTEVADLVRGPGRHPALLAPPRHRTPQLPRRAHRALLAHRGPAVARGADRPSPGRALRRAPSRRDRSRISHGQHREAHPRRAHGLAGALPHPRRRATQQDLHPQDRRRAVPRRGGELQGHRRLRRPGTRQGDGRRLGGPVARRAGAPQADHPIRATRGSCARTSTRSGDRVTLANLSHGDVQAWVTDLAATHSPATVQKIHRVLSLVLDLAVKRRPARPQRRPRGQPAAGPPARAPLPHPPAGRRPWPPRPDTPRTRASTAAWTPAPTRPTGSWCCSSPTPASGSGRWPLCAWPGSTWSVGGP